ncbi:hypothetical protein GGI11_000188 [Coemansia sp. RSA 2049]|nr:hypothetical protein GGI11_000188 [Coemansia sp. RSA 2049]
MYLSELHKMSADFVYSGIIVTPPVEYTTEYFTATTTVDQIAKLQPSTVYTTVPITLTDTTTITVSTQASDVMETVTSNYYITTTSTSAETNLQTDVMWVQTLLDETTTYVYTMRSLDRFQPYYLSTQDFVYSGIIVTPPVEYTTEYFTATTTVDQIAKLQPSTVYTTVPITLTDTTTITVSTQASDVMETVTSNYYITTTSTSAETNLQTDVMWVQTLLDETTTYVYTMRSLDRFQPYYLSTQLY